MPKRLREIGLRVREDMSYLVVRELIPHHNDKFGGNTGVIRSSTSRPIYSLSEANLLASSIPPADYTPLFIGSKNGRYWARFRDAEGKYELEISVIREVWYTNPQNWIWSVHRWKGHDALGIVSYHRTVEGANKAARKIVKDVVAGVERDVWSLWRGRRERGVGMGGEVVEYVPLPNDFGRGVTVQVRRMLLER